MLRAIATAFALAATGAAAWFLYQAFFVLERFGAMAILLAFALLLVATLCWWLAAEGSQQLVRRRTCHVFVGGIVGLVIATIAAAIPDFRERGPRLGFADLSFIAGFMDGPPAFIIGSYLGFLYSLVRLRQTGSSNQTLEPTPDRLEN